MYIKALLWMMVNLNIIKTILYLVENETKAAIVFAVIGM